MVPPKSDNDKANETMGGLIVLILIAVAGYFGWQWMSGGSNVSQGNDSAAFQQLGKCIEINDIIMDRFAILEASGLTSGNGTYFLLNNARSEATRLQDLAQRMSSRYAEELRGLGTSPGAEIAKGRGVTQRAFSGMVATGNRNAFEILTTYCNNLR